jgi:hypothetical protein
MVIIVQRKDLKAIRQQRLLAYRKKTRGGGEGGCCPEATGCCQ